MKNEGERADYWATTLRAPGVQVIFLGGIKNQDTVYQAMFQSPYAHFTLVH